MNRPLVSKVSLFDLFEQLKHSTSVPFYRHALLTDSVLSERLIVNAFIQTSFSITDTCDPSTVYVLLIILVTTQQNTPTVFWSSLLNFKLQNKTKKTKQNCKAKVRSILNDFNVAFKTL